MDILVIDEKIRYDILLRRYATRLEPIEDYYFYLYDTALLIDEYKRRPSQEVMLQYLEVIGRPLPNLSKNCRAVLPKSCM